MNEALNLSPATMAAQHYYASLIEYAKSIKHSSREIKYLNKNQAKRKGYHHADAVVEWPTGPKEWAYNMEPVESATYSFAVETGTTVCFFDNEN